VSQPLLILYEDSHVIGVVKPAGQFTQGTWAPPGELTLEETVRRHLDPANPRSVYLGIVHRLDRPASGVLVWAKTPKAARRLSSQFERRRVVKEYWAIVELGHAISGAEPSAGPERENVDHASEAWTDWLTRANDRGVVSCVEPETRGARRAVTRVRFASATSLPPGCAWLILWPETGRTHQLRAQAARRGMPILGDSLYGWSVPFALSPGIALHARSVHFRHPILNSPMTLVAPLPACWASLGIILPDTVSTGQDS
jgi:23S rRNA-/tRNA-specific pseudouridylate synthase